MLVVKFCELIGDCRSLVDFILQLLKIVVGLVLITVLEQLKCCNNE